MSTVWKFQFPIADRFTLVLPRAAQVLAVETQRGTPCLWALVDPDGHPETRMFAVVGTGHPCPYSALDHLGSFQMLAGDLVFVWHLFEVRS